MWPWRAGGRATGVSVLIRLALFRFLDIKDPYITFLPGVILAAYIGGLWPGLLATLLSALAADYFLTTPRYSLYMDSPTDIYALALFVLAAAAFSAICESRLRSRRRTAAGERRYAVTLASIGDAVIATDTEGRVTFLNPVAEVLTGWRLAEAVGQPLVEVFRIINEQTRQPAEDPAAKVLRLGTKVGLANHTALLARDGREMPIDDCGAPILNEHGDIAGVVLVFRDVTQRRQAEEAEAFRRANERFCALVQNSSDMISLFDAEGTVLYHSPAVERLLGYRPEDRIGRNVFRDPIVHPDDLGNKRVFFDAIRNQPGVPVAADFRLRHANGSWRRHRGRRAELPERPAHRRDRNQLPRRHGAQTGGGEHSSGQGGLGADVRQRARPDRHP